MSGPDLVYLDADADAQEGVFPRCFANPKYCSEPAIEYVHIDEVQALIAGAFEAAAREVDTAGDAAVTGALSEQLCCSGHMCGCQGADVGTYLLHIIRALTPADAIAARDAMIAAERQACALIALDQSHCGYPDHDGNWHDHDPADVGRNIAAAIRKRGEG